MDAPSPSRKRPSPMLEEHATEEHIAKRPRIENGDSNASSNTENQSPSPTLDENKTDEHAAKQSRKALISAESSMTEPSSITPEKNQSPPATGQDELHDQKDLRYQAGPRGAVKDMEAKKIDASVLRAELGGLDKPHLGRDGLRRSIALALQHVGFDSASEEALEAFATTTETYLTRFVEQLKYTAEASRREHPVPADFASILKRHNTPLRALKPHRRNPIAKAKLAPKTYDPYPVTTDYFKVPSEAFLGDELSGDAEKQKRTWIPSSLPAFPSTHTYKSTTIEIVSEEPARLRAEALADARKGEKALRGIDRASKITKQKEVRDVARRHPLARARHEKWESMMLSLLQPKGAGATVDRSNAQNMQSDIADHSVIVDSTAPFHRKEVPRSSNRAQQDGLIKSS